MNPKVLNLISATAIAFGTLNRNIIPEERFYPQSKQDKKEQLEAAQLKRDRKAAKNRLIRERMERKQA